MRPHLPVAFLIACTLGASEAHAQSTAWGEKGYISFNGMYRNESTDFNETTTFDLNHESASVRAGHRLEPGPLFDITAGGRIKGNLGMGFGVSYIRRSEAATVDAALPHPFYFNQPRTVTGNAAGLRHQDLAIHAHAMWLLPFSESVQVALFGGPTFFKVTQQIVTAVQFTDEYPFDQATYTGVSTVDARGTRVGYNAGTDVSVFFSQYVGIGGLARFTRGTVQLPSPGSGEVSIDTGGLQAGAGLRVRF